MLINQSDRHASVRAATGTTLNYEGDWHALFTLAGVPAGDFNGRLLAWINGRLGTTYNELNGAMNAFAVNQGFTSWSAMGAFDASGTPLMPSGAVAIYYADQAVMAGRKYIPNAVKGSAPVAINYLSTSRRMLANNFAGQAGATVTESAVAGADGKVYASTVVAAGDFYGLLPALPAGTYTIAYDVKRNTGTDQQFAIAMLNLGQQSPTKTATSTWTRVSWTFTIASTEPNPCLFISFDRATGTNIQIDNYCLVAGSSDPSAGVAGVSLIETNPPLYFGDAQGAADGNVTASGNVVTMANKIGIIQLPDPVTVTDLTVVGINARNTSSGWVPFICKLSSFTTLAVMQELDNGQPSLYWNGAQLTVPATTLLKFPRTSGSGQNFFAMRGNASGFTEWYDNEALFRSNSGLSSVSLDDLYVNTASTPGIAGSQDLFAMAIYTRSLTDQEVMDARTALLARAVSKSVTVNSTFNSRVIVFEGDSITAGVFANTVPLPSAFLPNASPSPSTMMNYATGGATLSIISARGPTLPVPKAGVKNIYYYAGGTNNLNNGDGDPSALLASTATFLDGLRAAGWLVALATVTPRSGGTNGAINAYNTAIAGWVGTHCDALIDYRTITTTGWQDPTNTTYWQSLAQDGTGGLHPTNAGAAVMEAVCRPIINGL